MARGKQKNINPTADVPANNTGRYVKLENRLVLLAWLNSLFGYKSVKELLNDVKQADEGFDNYGRSYIYHHLVGRGEKLKIPVPTLGRYDDNIHNYLSAINERRPEPITLRYFQYLALLYTEVFLDWRFNKSGELLRAINEFVRGRNARRSIGDLSDPEFNMNDFDKMAFWMATGSGKTLIMHVNYRQFLNYGNKALDNILLITPNEGLTEQHLAEMTASNIHCERFNFEQSSLGYIDQNIVRVIEITKLVEEKRGGGVSVPVEAFEGNNLILVDEGHKGSGGEAWRRFRDALGQTGFTFEYSATFGQALTAARNDVLTTEYGKAIAFDYSYKYFHGDGYGKDFHILNLKDETTEDQTELLLLGNMLSFYEQQKCFGEQSNVLRPYNLDRPLWMFIGSSVTTIRSDVLTVARFLHHFLENKRGWAVRAIQNIIAGKTELEDSHGENLFAGRFNYLRSTRQDAIDIYRDLLACIFNSPVGGPLHICDIRGRAGELGLKVSTAEKYFGLIYIGDTNAFKNLVLDDDIGIVIEEDVISESLFDVINSPETPINVLIGAKKFIEGWNSWRVSNMGLLNIGRKEGSEIIQLFGRGVRLRGLGFTLKRSSSIDGEHPQYIKLLETLNIFAVRANYMAQFREYLEREGVETEGCVELSLAIHPNKDFLNKGLFVPNIPEGRLFATECNIALSPDKAATVTADMSLKVESMRSTSGGVTTVSMKAGQERVIPPESIDLVDWGSIYVDLLTYKEQKGFSNLVITQDMPRKLLEAESPKLYRLVADESVARPRSFSEVSLLKETVITILRKYTDKYYRICQERWESDNMVYDRLSAKDSNFRDYVIRIPRNEAELITAVKKLMDEGKRIYEKETIELPNIYFDRHLYQPLLVEKGDKIRSEPPGLKPSEVKFVDGIRRFVRMEADKSLATKEMFLLRNLSRGKGIGFFENEGFFPDFILWIKEGAHQRIVFIEPHGMFYEKTYWTSDKARLHERLAKLSKDWGEKAGLKNIALDSFIISATPYSLLQQYYGTGNWSLEQFANAHILFFENDDYPAKLFA